MLCPLLIFGGKAVDLERGESCSLGSPRVGYKKRWRKILEDAISWHSHLMHPLHKLICKIFGFTLE